MKRLAFIIALFLGMTSTSASDELTFHKGHVAKGKVVLNEATYIKFIYEGESAETTIGKIALAQIKYNSGRIEECSEKVEILDPKTDFEKVQIFRDKEDTSGLTRLKEISAKSGGEWAISLKEGRYTKKTIQKLQKQAVEMGGCAILITTEKGNSAGFFKNANSSMTAVVFKY